MHVQGENTTKFPWMKNFSLCIQFLSYFWDIFEYKIYKLKKKVQLKRKK